MRISTKRILSIGLAGVFFISALFVYLNLIQGEMKIINEKRAKVATQNSLYNNQQQAINQVESLINQFKNVKDIQETVSLAIPNGEQTVRALRQIEAIGSASAVKISSAKFEVLSSRSSAQSFLKKIGVLEINVSARGDYQALKSFVKRIETTVRIANVNKLIFKPAGTKTAQDTVELVVEMYFQI